jgi:hypothetical protein
MIIYDTLYAGGAVPESSSGGGGGSSVAEYEYIKTGGVATYPETPYTEGASWFYTDANAYKEGKNLFNAYCGYASATLLFDGNEETSFSPFDQKLFFNFNGKPLTKMILLVDNTHYNNGKITLYGANDIAYATGIMDKLYEISVPARTTKTTFEIKNDKDYKFFRLETNDSRTAIYSLTFLSDGTVIKMPLKTANMTPTLQGFSEDYMRVITQDWYNGSEIIPSQTLIFKPYEDGGCLVNYTDDGKAANLKMYYLKSNGELVNREYSNFEVIGDLKTDVNTGIVSGFNDTTKILIPQTIASDNWSVSLKVKYTATSKHQGLFVDETQFKALGEIRHTIQKMSFWSGSWIDGTVNLEDGAEYWFLFVFANDTWTSYVKKDEGYKTCPNAEEMSVNFTITDFTSRYGSMIEHQLGMGYGESGEYWDSYMDMSTISLVDNGTEIWNASKLSPARDGYVLSPNDNFTLDGYGEKTQVADLSIPDRK